MKYARSFYVSALVSMTVMFSPMAMESARAATLEKTVFLLPSAPSVPAFIPLVLAKHLGYYAEHGLDVEFVSAKGGVDVAKQVGVGNAPVGVALGETPIIVRSNGVPVKSVGVLGGGAMTSIVGRKDRGISKVADLKGKRVSVLSFQDSTYYALLGTLASVGLSKGDVDIQGVGPGGVSSLVLSGSVDACACVPEREVEILEELPDAVAIPTQKYLPSMAQAILSSDETIARKPELVRGIVAATLKAVKYITDDPQRAAAAYVAAMPSYEGKEKLVEKILKQYVAHVYGGQKVPGEMDPARLKTLQDFYMQEGLITRATPIENMYTNQFIK